MSIRTLSKTIFVCCFISSICFAQTLPVKIGTYKQEIPNQMTTFNGEPILKVLSIAMQSNNAVLLGSENGLFRLQNNQWQKVKSVPSAPVTSIHVYDQTILIAAGDEIYQHSPTGFKRIAKVDISPINDVFKTDKEILFATDQGLYRLNESGNDLYVGEIHPFLDSSKVINALATNNAGHIAIAADAGLIFFDGSDWKQVFPSDKNGRSWAPINVKGVLFDSKDRLWFASPQGVGCYDGSWTLYTGKEGLPYNDFTCIAAGMDGSVWFGTKIGAIRFDGKQWAYRQGKRWLPNDHITDITISADGDAWIATQSGISQIESPSNDTG
jgi:ligand-binding sensor domain-containing protein